MGHRRWPAAGAPDPSKVDRAIKKLQHPIRSRKLEGFIDTKAF